MTEFKSHNFPPLGKEPDGPHIYIQWKGTDACIDVHCACDETWHMDQDFLYFIKCPYCGRVYETSCHIEIFELQPREVAQLDSFQIKEGEKDSDES